MRGSWEMSGHIPFIFCSLGDEPMGETVWGDGLRRVWPALDWAGILGGPVQNSGGELGSRVGGDYEPTLATSFRPDMD